MSGAEKKEAPDEFSGTGGADWLGRLRGGLEKTREGLLSRVGGRFPARMDEEAFDALEEALYLADLGPALVGQLMERLRAGDGEGGDAGARVKAIMRDCFENPAQPPPALPRAAPPGAPRVVLLVGVNGAGKTTTAGKLAARLSRTGQKVILAAGDTFRAAAGEQLGIWAERSGAGLIRHKEGADPAAVVHDAVQAAKARRADHLLVDTAGRQHTNKNLMEELGKIARVAARLVDDAPHEVLLVLDAMAGQNVLSQVREFGPALGVTGLVLTKLDGTAKGGVALGATWESGIPARYIGVGEGAEDLMDFDVKTFVDAILEGSDTSET